MNQLKSLFLSSVIAFSLTGCAAWDAYFMAHYDDQEYSLINKIRTKAQIYQEDCVDNPLRLKQHALELKGLAVEFRNFAEHIPDNDEAHRLGNQIVQLTEQALDQSKNSNSTSTYFCKAKLQQIERNANTIQKVIGSKPR